MNHIQFYQLIDQTIEAAPGTIKGNEDLASLSAWDSLAVVGFISMLDKTLQLRVSAQSVINAKTVRDLLALASEKLTS